MPRQVIKKTKMFYLSCSYSFFAVLELRTGHDDPVLDVRIEPKKKDSGELVYILLMQILLSSDGTRYMDNFQSSEFTTVAEALSFAEQAANDWIEISNRMGEPFNLLDYMCTGSEKMDDLEDEDGNPIPTPEYLVKMMSF